MEIIFDNISNKVFHNLSFKIKEGEIVGITGTGKTTLLKMINYILPIEGNVTYKDIPYNKKNEYEIRKKIVLVESSFQHQFLVSTVKEYMLLLIRYYKINIKSPEKKVLAALKMVGLTEHYLEKELSILSSSEQKLLQISLALLANPTVLLLDEPFMNLDMKAQKKIERLLERLKERYQKTIIIASEDSNLLYNLTEKVIFLKNGTILRQGKTTELYQNVKFLMKYNYQVPDIVLFTYKAKELNNAKIDYHKDIRDLIKDVYKHV